MRLRLSGDAPATLLSHRGSPVRTAEFMARAAALARALPPAAFAVNLAENRHHFLLGWVAACLREQVTLLPPAHTEEVLAGLRHAYPDQHTLDDETIERLLAEARPGGEAVPARPDVPADRVVAIAFTSGSTGEPQPHPKTWGSLFHNSRLAAAELVGGQGQSIIATVPPQHMYGLEASLIGALTAGQHLHDGKPFFPADVRAALENMPAPRTLVTTPAHLRVLTGASLQLPALDRVISATAPLPRELAQETEARWNTRVFEIYGCTEAGVMAHRRTTQSQSWRPFPGCHMTAAEDAAVYHAPHLSGPVPLPDIIESLPDGEFLLCGRAGDMVKVAGKRASLQELTRQVLSIPGVLDAVVFVPGTDARPAAAVVAPGATVNGILAALRARLDGVFVPRPLVIVDALPRNAVGKLPREALLQLLERPR